MPPAAMRALYRPARRRASAWHGRRLAAQRMDGGGVTAGTLGPLPTRLRVGKGPRWWRIVQVLQSDARPSMEALAAPGRLRLRCEARRCGARSRFEPHGVGSGPRGLCRVMRGTTVISDPQETGDDVAVALANRTRLEPRSASWPISPKLIEFGQSGPT